MQDDVADEAADATPQNRAEPPRSIPDALLHGDDEGGVVGGVVVWSRLRARSRRGRSIAVLIAVPIIVAAAIVAGALAFSGRSGLPGAKRGAAAVSPRVTVTAVAASRESVAGARLTTLHCPASEAPIVEDTGRAADYLSTCGFDGSRFLLGPSVLSGAAVETASVKASLDSSGAVTGAFEVDITLNASGTKMFAALTRQIASSAASGDGTGLLAIVVDGYVIAAPVVDSAITTGSMSIDRLSQTSAEDLAQLLDNYPEALLFRPVIDVKV